MAEGRKEVFTNEEIDEHLEKLVQKWKKQKYMPRRDELLNSYIDEENKKGNLYYLILKRYNKKVRDFLEFYNIEHIYSVSKTKYKLIDKFVEQCRKNNHFPAYADIRNNDKKIYSIITNTYNSLENFAKEHEILDIYKASHKKRVNVKRPTTRKKQIVKEAEIISRIQKEVKSIGNKIVLVGKIGDMNLDCQLGNNNFFSVERYLEENGILRIPSHIYKFLKELEKEKQEIGYIDQKKWMKIINQDKKLQASLYYRYKNNVLEKLIDAFGL